MLSFVKLIMEYGNIREYSYFQETQVFRDKGQIYVIYPQMHQKKIIPSHIQSDREKERIWTCVGWVMCEVHLRSSTRKRGTGSPPPAAGSTWSQALEEEHAPAGPGPGLHRTTTPASSLSPSLQALLHAVVRELSKIKVWSCRAPAQTVQAFSLMCKMWRITSSSQDCYEGKMHEKPNSEALK